MLKLCSQCDKLKEITYFKKENRNKSGVTCWCKDCVTQLSKKYYKINKNKILENNRLKHKKSPWKSHFYHLRDRCDNINNKFYHRYGGRGIKCLITLDEIKKLWYRDKGYLLKKPSIDREDNDGNYEYGNCRFIELSENSKLSNIKHARKILQFDLNKIFIHEWLNAKEIEKNTSFLASTIRANCRGKIKTAYKYIWEYKKGVK